uniref:protein-tyrosine-phosphatase n=1 Tax=Chromera velia CCMP2878 TaxID=1169474 RepID=A0A0G4G6F4_9ALVE|eukprot:Cvel_20385.t1-p1 / transcript=Cvel_20385.t1 / gene=Cvel_20385 / organism=Chromera_velia_CCMP2878 / gene_product=Dual specificity protein phosphatase 1, putative / transcript_product=Dual specificity protein phosphatase 1, putative / location=Cvel_scaffold1824:24204-27691(+) / protein_length=952 / sequence_SO=supercontig / SO=protein_coding / is_pseudo=false
MKLLIPWGKDELRHSLDADEVLPGLYLGSEAAVGQIAIRNSLGITHILSLMHRLPPTYPRDLVSKFVEIYDDPDDSILKVLQDCIDFIDRGLETRGVDTDASMGECREGQRGKVLVHCSFGISRSSSVVIGYLMVKRTWPFQQAFEFVKSKRAYIMPNEGFERQLLLLEESGCDISLALQRSTAPPPCQDTHPMPGTQPPVTIPDLPHASTTPASLPGREQGVGAMTVSGAEEGSSASSAVSKSPFNASAREEAQADTRVPASKRLTRQRTEAQLLHQNVHRLERIYDRLRKSPSSLSLAHSTSFAYKRSSPTGTAGGEHSAPEFFSHTGACRGAPSLSSVNSFTPAGRGGGGESTGNRGQRGLPLWTSTPPLPIQASSLSQPATDGYTPYQKGGAEDLLPVSPASFVSISALSGPKLSPDLSHATPQGQTQPVTAKRTAAPLATSLPPATPVSPENNRFSTGPATVSAREVKRSRSREPPASASQSSASASGSQAVMEQLLPSQVPTPPMSPLKASGLPSTDKGGQGPANVSSGTAQASTTFGACNGMGASQSFDITENEYGCRSTPAPPEEDREDDADDCLDLTLRTGSRVGEGSSMELATGAMSEGRHRTASSSFDRAIDEDRIEPPQGGGESTGRGGEPSSSTRQQQQPLGGASFALPGPSEFAAAASVASRQAGSSRAPTGPGQGQCGFPADIDSGSSPSFSLAGRELRPCVSGPPHDRILQELERELERQVRKVQARNFTESGAVRSHSAGASPLLPERREGEGEGSQIADSALASAAVDSPILVAAAQKLKELQGLSADDPALSAAVSALAASGFIHLNAQTKRLASGPVDQLHSSSASSNAGSLGGMGSPDRIPSCRSRPSRNPCHDISSSPSNLCADGSSPQVLFPESEQGQRKGRPERDEQGQPAGAAPSPSPVAESVSAGGDGGSTGRHRERERDAAGGRE